MTSVTPRSLVHRGSVEAWGFHIRRDVDERVARDRVLALWAPGVAVHDQDDGYVVVLPAPVRVQVDLAPGTPLTRMGGALVGAPLTDGEMKALQVPPRSVVLIAGGACCVHPLKETDCVDVALWLDLSMFERVTVRSLGTIPLPRIPEPVVVNLREHLPGAPAVSETQAAVVAALKERAAKKSAPRERQQVGLGWLESLASFVSKLLSPAPEARSLPAPNQSTQVAPPQPVPESGLNRWLRSLLNRFAIESRLINVLGQRQAEYLYRMVEMFERGDFQDALRHAIPLSDMPGNLGSLSLSLPTPRQGLGLSLGPLRSGSSMLPVGEDLHAQLRRMYRNAYERLAAQGKIEEAVFVLEELLQVHEEAVEFLEKHGRLTLAAQLAESRCLAPGLVVRQWFIAGNVERALELARLHGAFADAVVRLEKRNQEKAGQLRILWAESLAASGMFLPAADVALVMHTPEIKRMVAEWLEQAVALGGTPGARALARRLSLHGSTNPQDVQYCETLLANESLHDAPARLAFAQALMERTMTPPMRMLARPAARALWRDATAGCPSMEPGDFRRLVDLSEDGALRTDMPSLRRATAHSAAAKEFTWTLDGADVGAMPAHDAFLLPDGKCVVALGEPGVRILSRDGRNVAHVEQPASALVPSFDGAHAIGLIKRGEVWRTFRLDPAQRSGRPWIDVALRSWACGYDGSLWFVGVGHDLLALDALAATQKALWRVPDVGPTSRESTVECIGISSSWLTFVSGHPTRWVWRYEIPSPMLRVREEHASPTTDAFRSAVWASGFANLYIVGESTGSGGTGWLCLDVRKSGGMDRRLLADPKELPTLSMGQELFLSVTVHEPWVACAWADSHGVRVVLMDVNNLRTRSTLNLQGRQRVSLRLDAHHLVIADDRGTVTVVALQDGGAPRVLRVGC